MATSFFVISCNDPADALETFFEQEAKAQTEANSRVSPEQMLQPGDFCVCQHDDLNVYSAILDAADHLLEGRNLEDLDEDERAEIESTREDYKAEHMRFFRFTRSFSSVCPRGELGDIHLSTVTRKITKDEFEAARKAGWS